MKSLSSVRGSSIRMSTQQSTENVSINSSSSKEKIIRGKIRNLDKFIEDTSYLKQKRIIEEKKANRIKRELELHQQLCEELEGAAIIIQKHARGYIARKQYSLFLIEKYKQENFLLQVDNEIEEY